MISLPLRYLVLPTLFILVGATNLLSTAEERPAPALVVQSPEAFDRAQLKPTPTPTFTPTQSRCVPQDCNGDFAPSSYDVNGDCKVTEDDFTEVVKYLNANLKPKGIRYVKAADVNHDGAVSPADALVISNRLGAAECLATPTPTETPTWTPTYTPTYTPTHTPTPTYTPTETPTPTPTSKPQQACELYRLDFKHTAASGKYDGPTVINQTDPHARQLECFSKMIQKLDPKHDPSRVTTSETEMFTTKLWRDLLALQGRDRGTDNDDAYLANREFIDCKGSWKSPRADGHNAHFMIGGGARGGKKGTLTPGCSNGYLYLDNDCKLQRVEDVKFEAKGCYISLTAQVGTPLSLKWKSDYKELPSTVVSFKLNPHSESASWMWRASGSLPLLVYDPKHLGVITSAEQLFGPWTFGGKSREVSHDSAGSTIPWRDGYEALGSLDADRDGKIADKELADLGVWFDYNRDGISQPGEVKKPSEVSLNAVFISPDGKEGGALVASKGFERVVDGKTVQGGSIDWLEHDVRDAAALSLGDVPSIDGARQESEPGDRGDRARAKNAAAEPRVANASALAGTWRWSIDNKPEQVGFLAFESEPDGISGVTILPLMLQGMQGSAAQIAFSHFVGSMTQGASGDSTVTFQVQGMGDAVIDNVATISADGTLLQGTATVTGSSLSRSGAYQYTWTAKRAS
jgi:Dockerin type I domain